MNERILDGFAKFLASNPKQASLYRDRRVKDIKALIQEAKRAGDPTTRDYLYRQAEQSRLNFEDLQRRFRGAKQKQDESAQACLNKAKELFEQEQLI